MSLATWIHHLLEPHCAECQLAAQENKVCASCETLKLQLAIANSEKQALLESILAFTKPAAEQQSPQVDPKHVAPKMMTWNVRRQMLEAEDRKQAAVIAEQRKRDEAIAKLEKETGIETEVKDATA
jgi:hypothetical protein